MVSKEFGGVRGMYILVVEFGGGVVFFSFFFSGGDGRFLREVEMGLGLGVFCFV